MIGFIGGLLARTLRGKRPHQGKWGPLDSGHFWGEMLKVVWFGLGVSLWAGWGEQ